ADRVIDARRAPKPLRRNDLLARRRAREHETHRRSAAAFREGVRDGTRVARADAAPAESGTASRRREAHRADRRREVVLWDPLTRPFGSLGATLFPDCGAFISAGA